MPSIGPLEILVVGVVALIVFGPEKLPEIARTIGRTASQLRRMASDLKEDFDMGMDLDDEDEAGRRPTPGRPTSRHASSRPERLAAPGEPDGGWVDVDDDASEVRAGDDTEPESPAPDAAQDLPGSAPAPEGLEKSRREDG
ncbi:MAG: Sec-independent protein translocase protein TatB [Actinomycetota bacterium]